MLYNDLINASELTVVARKSQEEIEAESIGLAQFFPAQLVDDTVAKYSITDTGLVPAAEYRAFDAEATIGAPRGGRQVAIQLPPVSQKNRTGELDQLRANAGSQQAIDNIANTARDTTIAVLNRIEAMRGTVLETGRVTIEENGFFADEDLGRDPEMTTQAATLWSDAEATPLDDLLAWAEKYEERNGELPGAIIASPQLISLFQRSKQVQSAIGGTAVRNVASLDEISSVLSSYGLPALTRFAKSINIGGTTRKLLSPNKLFFLPAPGSGVLGQTVFGRTAEALDAEYGIARADAPGLIAGVHKEWDPYAYWTRVNALALPVLTSPNASMVATVS